MEKKICKLKNIARIMFNNKRMNAFSVRLGRRQGCPLSKVQCRNFPEISIYCSKARKIKGIHTVKEEVKLLVDAHSSVLAWRIPGTGEPGRLPSMGSHRLRHD